MQPKATVRSGQPTGVECDSFFKCRLGFFVFFLSVFLAFFLSLYFSMFSLCMFCECVIIYISVFHSFWMSVFPPSSIEYFFLLSFCAFPLLSILFLYLCIDVSLLIHLPLILFKSSVISSLSVDQCGFFFLSLFLSSLRLCLFTQCLVFAVIRRYFIFSFFLFIVFSFLSLFFPSPHPFVY